MNDMSDDDDNIFRQPPKLCKEVEGPNSYSCKFCHSSFSDKSNCNRHEHSCSLNLEKSLAKFSCPDCKKNFNRKDNFKRHLEKCKPDNHRKDVPLNCKFCNIPSSTKSNLKQHERGCKANIERCLPVFQCDNCESQFNKKFHLIRHLKQCTPDKPQKPILRKTPCLIGNCSSSFFRKTDLINHLSSTHPDKISIKPKETKTFSSPEEFLAWKEKEEENTFSYFTARKGQKSKKTKYFYCQHDGSEKFHTKGNIRKTSRRQNLSRFKVGHHCFSKIKMTLTENGTVSVEYYPTHSHLCEKADQSHHPIPRAMSNYIDKKLNEKVPPAVVYDLVKEHFLPKGNSEIHKTRAGNLTRHLVLERGRRRSMKLRFDKDDAKSVFFLAAQHIQEDDSVLIYKPVGDKVIHGPQKINDLPDSKELFMFGFQTDKQLALMKKHCGKILVVDETHGTNPYNYKLLTVMVIDENRRGWPVAHLISSRSDADTLQYFFQTLRERLDCQPSIINTVITDDDSALINAMEAGFSQTLTHLLCKWHIIKNLRENLRKKGPRDLFDTMFSEVKVIVNAEDENSFSTLKEGFKNKYAENSNATEYMTYLDDNYWERAEKWAMCYRRFPHANVDTTGHVESFHNRLKTNAMKRKPFKRLDDLINLLYTIAWDDECTRCREAKAGFSVQPQKIIERHRKGLLLLDDIIVEQSPECGLWEVSSGSSNGTYFITRHLENCESEHCYSKCPKPECHGLCSHLFSCSCPDSHPLCKHIHKLQSYLFRNVPLVLIEKGFYNFETVESSEICEEPRNDGNEAGGETATVHDRRKQIHWEKLKGHLAELQEFMAQDPKNVSEHRILYVEATLASLMPSLKPEESEVVMSQMEPAVTFTPSEKLKTQASQLSSFKKPPKRRRRKEDSASLAAKKRQAIESLSQHAEHDSIDAVENDSIDAVENDSIGAAKDGRTDD